MWKADNHLRRLDTISYGGDAYGQTKATSPYNWGKTPDAKLGENGYVITNRAASDVKEWMRMATKGRNETIFKGTLSIFDDVEVIWVPSDQYDNVIATFKKHKVTVWPDGRSLTDVIKKGY